MINCCYFLNLVLNIVLKRRVSWSYFAFFKANLAVSAILYCKKNISRKIGKIFASLFPSLCVLMNLLPPRVESDLYFHETSLPQALNHHPEVDVGGERDEHCDEAEEEDGQPVGVLRQLSEGAVQRRPGHLPS